MHAFYDFIGYIKVILRALLSPQINVKTSNFSQSFSASVYSTFSSLVGDSRGLSCLHNILHFASDKLLLHLLKDVLMYLRCNASVLTVSWEMTEMEEVTLKYTGIL